MLITLSLSGPSEAQNTFFSDLNSYFSTNPNSYSKILKLNSSPGILQLMLQKSQLIKIFLICSTVVYNENTNVLLKQKCRFENYAACLSSSLL